jgi:hypothetical protein
MLTIQAASLKKGNSDTNLNARMMSEIEVHLLSLKEEFSRYFPDIASDLFPIVKSPFTFNN